MNLACVHNIDKRLEIQVQTKMWLDIEIPKNKI